MDGYKTYTGPTTRTHSRRKEKKKRSPGLRLSFCMGLVIIVVFMKLLFPGFYDKISSKISERTDFESAFNAIGEGLSGKRSISEAFEDAFQYAFAPEKKRDDEKSAEPEVTPDTDVITV